VNKVLALAVAWLTAAGLCMAEELTYDEIYLKDDTVFRGKIVERRYGESIVIETSDGRVAVKEEDISVVREDNAVTAQTKSPATALVLSLVLPGLGQYYNGQPVKGIFQELVWAGGIAMIFGAAHEPYASEAGTQLPGYVNQNVRVAGYVAVVAGLIWSAIDAPISASRISEKRLEEAYARAIASGVPEETEPKSADAEKEGGD
jgi:hypothetical protein